MTNSTNSTNSGTQTIPEPEKVFQLEVGKTYIDGYGEILVCKYHDRLFNLFSCVGTEWGGWYNSAGYACGGEDNEQYRLRDMTKVQDNTWVVPNVGLT